MHKTSIILICLLISSCLYAQSLNEFSQKKNRLDKNLMLTLGTWSTINLGTGIAGWVTQKGTNKHFHEMNTMWGTINFALAAPGLLNSRKKTANLSFSKLYKSQISTEKIFLFNTGLDVGYIAIGLYMNEKSKTAIKHAERLKGWGNSIIMQGSFLFLFDATATILHNRHRKSKLDPLLKNLDLSFNGSEVGITVNL